MEFNEEDYIMLEHGPPDSGATVTFIDDSENEYFGWCDDFNTYPDRKVTFFDDDTQKPVANVKAWCYWKPNPTQHRRM